MLRAMVKGRAWVHTPRLGEAFRLSPLEPDPHHRSGAVRSGVVVEPLVWYGVEGREAKLAGCWRVGLRGSWLDWIFHTSVFLGTGTRGHGIRDQRVEGLVVRTVVLPNRQKRKTQPPPQASPASLVV